MGDDRVIAAGRVTGEQPEGCDGVTGGGEAPGVSQDCQPMRSPHPGRLTERGRCVGGRLCGQTREGYKTGPGDTPLTPHRCSARHPRHGSLSSPAPLLHPEASCPPLLFPCVRHTLLKSGPTPPSMVNKTRISQNGTLLFEPVIVYRIHS